MGILDKTGKEFFIQEDVVEDLFNCWFQQSRTDLTIVSGSVKLVTDFKAVFAHVGKKRLTVLEKKRDILLEGEVENSAQERVRVFLGIELQYSPDRAMPFRVIQYDAAVYAAQYNRFVHENRQNRNLSPLVSMTESDMFVPVLTLVVFLGQRGETWPYSVRFSDLCSKELFPTAPMPLITLSAIQDADVASFQSDLALVVPILKARSEAEITKILANDPKYQTVEYRTANLIYAIGGCPKTAEKGDDSNVEGVIAEYMRKTKDEIREYKRQNKDLARSNKDLTKANDDLTKANDDLAKTNDDLAKTNDDLAKTNGDLAKTNEDLTKTNGDLAKTNEDLMRSNDDLKETVRDLQAQLARYQAGAGPSSL